MSTLLAISPNIGFFSRPLVILLVLVGLALGLQRAPSTAGRRGMTWLAVAVPLVVWFVLMTEIGQTDVYESLPWTRRLATLAPPLIWLTLLWRSTRIAAVLDAIPRSWLIGLQLYRVLGFVFLVQWAAGRVPGTFALPAGIGDLLTGGLALPVAVYVAHRAANWRAVGYAWNLLGLADFALALFLATFVVSSGLRYPLIMIPTFAVPLGIILHGLSLWQLARSRTAETPAPAAPHEVGAAALR